MGPTLIPETVVKNLNILELSDLLKRSSVGHQDCKLFNVYQSNDRNYDISNALTEVELTAKVTPELREDL